MLEVGRSSYFDFSLARVYFVLRMNDKSLGAFVRLGAVCMDKLNSEELRELIDGVRSDIQTEAEAVLSAMALRVGQIWKDLLPNEDCKVVDVRLGLTPSGELRQSHVLNSSGDAEADSNVRVAVESASPFFEVTEFYGGYFFRRYFENADLKIFSKY